jgi:hypothetical protein
MAVRRRPEASHDGLPAVLQQYDPRVWCDDPTDLYQAAYLGIHRYFEARKTWFIVEKGLPEPLAHHVAQDGTRFGPQWVISDGG